jgi:hypothetical protein
MPISLRSAKASLPASDSWFTRSGAHSNNSSNIRSVRIRGSLEARGKPDQRQFCGLTGMSRQPVSRPCRRVLAIIMAVRPGLADARLRRLSFSCPTCYLVPAPQYSTLAYARGQSTSVFRLCLAASTGAKRGMLHRGIPVDFPVVSYPATCGVRGPSCRPFESRR